MSIEDRPPVETNIIPPPSTEDILRSLTAPRNTNFGRVDLPADFPAGLQPRTEAETVRLAAEQARAQAEFNRLWAAHTPSTSQTAPEPLAEVIPINRQRRRHLAPAIGWSFLHRAT